MEPLELPLPEKTVNPKPFVPGGSKAGNATMRYLAHREETLILENDRNCHKLNQVLTLTKATDVANASFSNPIQKEHQKLWFHLQCQQSIAIIIPQVYVSSPARGHRALDSLSFPRYHPGLLH